MTYQEQWDSLQTRVSEFLSFLSQKCNKIHKVAAMHYATLVHFVEGQDPLLLANTPFFPTSEYFTREGRLFKQFKQSVLKQQEEAKAREDELLQKQLALEAALKKITTTLSKLSSPETHSSISLHILRIKLLETKKVPEEQDHTSDQKSLLWDCCP